jgi:hypothetical protein
MPTENKTKLKSYYPLQYRGRRGRMVVGFTTT